MKRQIIALVFAACFVNSFALADSPTDAPLMPSIQIPSTQQEKPDSKRRQGNRTVEAASQNLKKEKMTTKSDNCPKAGQPAPETPEPAADTNSSSAL